MFCIAVIRRQEEGRNYTICFPKDLEEETNMTLSIYETKLQRSLQVLFSIMQTVNILLYQLVLVVMFHAAGGEETDKVRNQLMQAIKGFLQNLGCFSKFCSFHSIMLQNVNKNVTSRPF